MLEEYVGKKKKVRLERKFPSEIYANGFIHWLGLDIFCAQVFHDFYCEGYAIYRRSDILNIRSNEYERFFEKMLHGEGIMAKVSPPSIPCQNSISSVLSYFASNNQNIIVECEFENEEDDIFTCGKVSEIEENTVWVKEFDALGNWCDQELGINIEEITKIQFNSPYLNTFTKYIPDIYKENT